MTASRSSGRTRCDSILGASRNLSTSLVRDSIACIHTARLYRHGPPFCRLRGIAADQRARALHAVAVLAVLAAVIAAIACGRIISQARAHAMIRSARRAPMLICASNRKLMLAYASQCNAPLSTPPDRQRHPAPPADATAPPGGRIAHGAPQAMRLAKRFSIALSSLHRPASFDDLPFNVIQLIARYMPFYQQRCGPSQPCRAYP